VQLRRHGDEMQRLPGGLYAALGRTDDNMNLGGIKVQCPSYIPVSSETMRILYKARCNHSRAISAD